MDTPISKVSPHPYLQKFRHPNVHLNYDPAVIEAWKNIRFRQTVASTLFPIGSLFSFALLNQYGNLSLGSTNLKTIAITIALSNILIVPFSLINFRCPRCGLFVTNPNRPRLHRYFINLFVHDCPHCHTTLR